MVLILLLLIPGAFAAGYLVRDMVAPGDHVVEDRTLPPVKRKRKVRPPQGSVVHIVVEGDTLSSIAQRHGTSWQQLFSRNRDIVTSPDILFPGQEIFIS